MVWAQAMKSLPLFCAILLGAAGAPAQDDPEGSQFFTGPVPHLQIEISKEGMKVLRNYVQELRQPRPERMDVKATVREGGRSYTNVAIHLKGSWSFQPIDAKPSLTLNFDKFAPGQRFHGLTKIHLNNSGQDPSYLCEQLGRELFAVVQVPSPRAGHALVKLNGRDLGLFVVIEGANKTFVKRHFKSAKGNLYDGGSGGDINKALEADSGVEPENRSDLTNLVKAAREPDPAKRLARLEAALDVGQFISFAATEDLIVHWDGYAIGRNNYRLFHDIDRDKMIFMPGGMDQLFGVSSSPNLPLTPVFKGLVAKALFSIPEARRRYLDRIAQLATNEFRAPAIQARVNRLAARVRPALASDRSALADFDEAVRDLKGRIIQRGDSVARQLQSTKRPVPYAGDPARPLTGWSFKPGPTQGAVASPTTLDSREMLGVIGRAPNSSGAWRTTLLLNQGHYEFTGRARTEGLNAAHAEGTNGVILRMSGERSTQGIAITDEWKILSYEFDVQGVEDVEIICEFRGPARTSGFFEAGSLRLVRKGPALDKRPPEIGE